MEPLTTVIVLTVWASIGSLFYETPPCEAWMQTQYLDDNGTWVVEDTRCTKQPVFW